MDYSEKWGSDVDEAVKLALDELGLTIDEVKVTVLEEPSKGFFGIGQKLALVRVEKLNIKKEAKPKKEKDIEKEIKKKALEKASLELEVLSDHPALTFLKELVKDMGLDVELTCKKGNDAIYVDIAGKDSATIIGKRGQTLDSIQYLTSLVVNKDESNYTRVVVDAEGYRKRREKTLEQLAMRLASKVSKQKKPVKLEPMNPYERKVIHATLQNHPHVKTRSEGEEPYRRVIIELK